MAAHPREVEVKCHIRGVSVFTRTLRQAGFRRITPRTHELNTLYDLAGYPLRRRGAILRIRRYGRKWTLTYKDQNVKGFKSSGKHKTRRELEIQVPDGRPLAAILEAAGFQPVFAYEKYRSEWADRSGHVVVDETPLGNLAEIEGPPSWIDKTARKLGITENQYITASYLELFLQWKKKTGSKAEQMLFGLCSK